MNTLKKEIKNDEDFLAFLNEQSGQEVDIHYVKEAGENGKTSTQLCGSGLMLFVGICEILKKLSEAEAKVNGVKPEEYVKFVCETVTLELREGR